MKITDRICSLKHVLMLLVFLQSSLPGADKIKYEEGKVYEHKLENGLEVYTIERHLAPVIYHQLTYRVGSRNEALGITGISHVVEHMMFKGTERYKKGQVSKIISGNSGIFNAFTANDMTSYYEYLPANKIEVALDIESDRMQNSTFDPSEFNSEIEVIKQERRMRSESNVTGIFRENLNSIAYDSHPNRDPVIGWPSDLEHMTRDEAYSYYKTYYTPNNAFLVLVGDFETGKMLELVKKYYGSIPKGPEVKELFAVEQIQKVRKSFTVYHNDIAETAFRMAFHIPEYRDPDAAALRVAGMILCERSRDARLHKKMVEKGQIATSVSGGFGMTKDPGLFSISVSMKPDSCPDRAEQMVWEEIEAMKNVPVEDRELQKVKNRFRFNEVTSYTKNNNIGEKISRYEAFFGYEFSDEFSRRVMSVTKDDLIRVMTKYFNKDQVTVGYMLPKKGDKSVTASQDGSKTGEDANNEFNTEQFELNQEEKFYYKIPTEKLNDISSDAGSADELIKPKPIANLIRNFTLDNGIKIYTIENHLVPAIGVIGFFETGNIPEANEGSKPGISDVLSDIMGRGSENMPYLELSERMAFVPFKFQMGGSYRGFSFQGYSLTDDAHEMMKTGFDIVTKPAFNDDDIKKIKTRHEISARNLFKKTGMKAFYYMYNEIFKDHPYSKVKGSVESIKSITKEDLKNLHKKYFRPEQLTLLMVGDMSPLQMKSLADKYFGEWKNKSKAPEIFSIPEVNKLNKKEIKVYTEKDYTECTINLGFAPTNNVDPDEQEAVDVLNYILASSALTSRMGIELRDKNGWIYGIKSELWAPNDNIGYWKFNTKTAPENTRNVIKGIFSEIEKLFEHGITDEELNTAKNRMLGLLPFYVETPDDVANLTYDLIREKKPLDYFDKKNERIVSVTKADVIKAAKKYFTLDNFIIVVDGPVEENYLNGLIDEL